jgi:hypothetical protein
MNRPLAAPYPGGANRYLVAAGQNIEIIKRGLKGG